MNTESSQGVVGAVVGLEDMNQDGVGDILFFATETSTAGPMEMPFTCDWTPWARLGEPRKCQKRLTTVRTGDSTGSAVVGVGDSNGDGIPEILGEALGREADAGTAWLLRGVRE